MCVCVCARLYVCVCCSQCLPFTVTILYKLYIYLQLNRNKGIVIITDIITLVPLKECMCDLPCSLLWGLGVQDVKGKVIMVFTSVSTLVSTHFCSLPKLTCPCCCPLSCFPFLSCLVSSLIFLFFSFSRLISALLFLWISLFSHFCFCYC